MRKKSRKLYRFMKSGAGEALSFIFAAPCMILVFVLLVAIIQTGLVKERLEYISYDACRKAVVQDTYDKGLKAAQKCVAADFPTSNIKYVTGSENVRIYISGLKAEPERYSKKDKQAWKKGIYVQCIVSAKINPVFAFMKKERSSSVIMMIENPAEGTGGYPWFDYYRR